MKNWTQGWLVYGPKKVSGNDKFVEKISVLGFDKESIILQNAINELDNGITGNEYIVMLAKSPEAKDSLKAEVKNIFERVVQQNSGNNKFKIIIMEHWEHALYMYNIYLNEENKENNFLA